MRKAIRRGDLFYADLNPVVGSEQGGMRNDQPTFSSRQEGGFRRGEIDHCTQLCWCSGLRKSPLLTSNRLRLFLLVAQRITNAPAYKIDACGENSALCKAGKRRPSRSKQNGHAFTSL